MANGTVIARRKGIDIARGDNAKSLRLERRINPAGIKKITAVEARQANEFAARIEITVRRQRKESPSAPARRNVAHQAACSRRHDAKQDIGKVRNHQLAPGLCVQLVRAVKCCEKCTRHIAISRLDATCAGQCAAQRIKHAGRYLMGMKEIDHLRQVRQIFRRTGGDHAPRSVATQLVHRFQHFVMNALAAPGLPGCIGNPGDRSIERQADTDIARSQKLDCFIVKQSAIGLQAKGKIIGKGINRGKHRGLVHERFGSVKNGARLAAFGHHRAKIAAQCVERGEQFVGRHVAAFAALLARQVTVSAVEIATLGRIEINARGCQFKAQGVQFTGKFAGLGAIVIEQRTAGQCFSNARLVDQRPESRVGVGQCSIGFVANVHAA